MSQRGRVRGWMPWMVCASGLSAACSDGETSSECIEISAHAVDDGVAELIASYESCAEHYQGWARELDSTADGEQVEGILEASRLYELAGLSRSNGVSAALTVAVNQLDAASRREIFEASSLELSDPAKECRDGRAALGAALAAHRTACDQYFEWEAAHRRDWEGYEDARSQYVESCGPLCPGVFVSYGYQLVPRPTGISTRAGCP